MGALRAFWRQPSSAYRNFQIAFAILTLNFFLPAISYVVAPEIAQESFSDIGRVLGGGAYGFPEAQSRVWRYLGAANVMTLALMCFLMMRDLRRYYVLLWPLCFLKGYNAALFVAGWFSTGYPAFLAVGLFDFATVAAFVHFSRAAWRRMIARPDEPLVPAPRSAA